MTLVLSPKAEQTLQRLMSGGEFESEELLVEEALALLVFEREKELLVLKAKIDEGIASLDRGEGIPLDKAFNQLKVGFKRNNVTS